MHLLLVGVCLLWLFIDAAGRDALCGESEIRTQSLDASTGMERKIAQPSAMQDKSSLVPRVVEPRRRFSDGAAKSVTFSRIG